MNTTSHPLPDNSLRTASLRIRTVNEHIHYHFYTNTYGSKLLTMGNVDGALTKATILLNIKDVENLQPL